LVTAHIYPARNAPTTRPGHSGPGIVMWWYLRRSAHARITGPIRDRLW